MVPEAAFRFSKRVKNTDYRNVNKMTRAKISRTFAGNARQCSPIVCANGRLELTYRVLCIRKYVVQICVVNDSPSALISRHVVHYSIWVLRGARQLCTERVHGYEPRTVKTENIEKPRKRWISWKQTRRYDGTVRDGEQQRKWVYSYTVNMRNGKSNLTNILLHERTLHTKKKRSAEWNTDRRTCRYERTIPRHIE